MKFLSLSEFERKRSAFDKAVLVTPQIADFCSSSSWILSAHYNIHRHDRIHDETLIAQENGHWMIFAAGAHPVLEPLESMWCFTCPLVGPDPEQSVELLIRCGEQLPHSGLRRFLVGGVPRNGALFRMLARHRDRFAKIEAWSAVQCMLVLLTDGGVPGYLNRRTKKFRRNIRRSDRLVHEAKISLEEVTELRSPLEFERLIAIHRRSRKWNGGDDIFQTGRFRDFYLQLAADASDSGGLRILVARRGNEDAAYIMGVVFGDTYRGLQMAYDDRQASLGLGSWLQVENMKRIAAEGVPYYDLGMHSPYKESWIDHRQDLVNCLISLP